MRTITVAGGTLFRLALEYLGDATQWDRIAALNGLSDPMLPPGQVLTLRIPDKGSSTSGGVLGHR